MNRRTLSLISACTACLLAAVSCGSAASGTETGTEKETSGASGTAPAVTAADTAAETEPVRIKADLPEADFGGETFTFFARVYDGTWTADDISADATNGEPINDALFDRTSYLEETYNVNLEVVPSNEGSFLKPIRSFISAGEDIYDTIVAGVGDLAVVSLDHMLFDLHDVEHIDLSKPWWSQMTNDSLTIGGRQYYATGDIFIADNKAARVFFFNKNLIAEYDLENPYDLVFDNKWTMEKFVELSDAVTADLNGDNQMKFEDDRYGTMAQDIFAMVMYIASGEHLSAKDENDLPYIAYNTDRAVSVMTGIHDLLKNSSSISMNSSMGITNGFYPDNIVYFMEGRALFAPDVLKHIETMRGAEIDIGILPPPKYDEAQSAYYCYADNWCVNALSIPVTSADPAKTGLLLEAMAADSANNLTPAYYELALTDKYARDEESVKMLDLILDSVVMDNAEIFKWGNITPALTEAMAKKGNITSTIEKHEKVVGKTMNKTIEKLLADAE